MERVKSIGEQERSAADAMASETASRRMKNGLAVSLLHRSSLWPLDNGGRSPCRSLARCLADGTGHRESGRCAAPVSARWTLWLLVVGTLPHSHTRTVDPNSDSESHADSGVCGVAVCR